MTASIAVVIPTRNRPLELQRALRSVYRQTLLPAEIIVVDDCSDQPTAEQIFSDCPPALKRTLFRNTRPLGAQSSRNLGLREAKAEYVALLDDDDEFHPDKIRILASVARCGTHVLYHAAQMTLDDERFSYVSTPAENIFFQDLLLRNLIGGTSMVCLHRKTFLSIGGFDESMPALQDYEAWLRCAKRGLTFQRVDGTLTTYHHLTSAGSISKSLEKVDQAIRRINDLYKDDYAQLSAAGRKEREERVAFTRTHRMLMNNQRWRAASYCLRCGVRLRSAKVALGALPALVGLKASIKIKQVLGL